MEHWAPTAVLKTLGDVRSRDANSLLVRRGFRKLRLDLAQASRQGSGIAEDDRTPEPLAPTRASKPWNRSARCVSQQRHLLSMPKTLTPTQLLSPRHGIAEKGASYTGVGSNSGSVHRSAGVAAIHTHLPVLLSTLPSQNGQGAAICVRLTYGESTTTLSKHLQRNITVRTVPAMDRRFTGQSEASPFAAR